MNLYAQKTCIALIAAVFLILTSAHAERASDHAIGSLYIGMTRTDFKALPFRVELFTVNEEGEDYPAERMFLGNGISVDVVFVNERIFELATASPSYVTAEGARVGDTLARLRSIYPRGRLYRGSEEGLYFNFRAEAHGMVFEFDADALGYDCVVKNAGCHHNLETLHARRLGIYE